MTATQLLVLGASVLAAAIAGGVVAQQADEQYVQLAEIEVDPVQLDAYRAAVQEQIDAAIRNEPGVLVLYAVSEKGNPTHVKVFEIYRDRSAYEAHLESDQFKKYKTTVEKMVKSLKLIQASPIMLGAQSN
ncbi:antibiotic biosynthesis monooxygenase [Bradyrhizobium japonicum]|uniref:Antibiotic biosynthesis monooxygenase n=1 Tax=Bradyrhizobium japonicum TaxID=375 RepID=A0A1Y2JXW9_BRAJP|nr:putative quinol monooxygenase [Bradyrhizobium japonicum]OSJ37009.1 antibiotic biosynthesis monooxygenase [Bradyrhizobium japonicum]